MLNIRLLEERRKVKKYSQEELATLIGRTREWYGKMLKSGNLYLKDLEKICNVLEISIEELIQKEEGSDYILKEANSEYKKQTVNNQSEKIIEHLIEQIKIKDDQIKFLQHVIDTKI